jgi:hypothetical protein
MNRLQRIQAPPTFVSLNPPTSPRSDKVWGQFVYNHPLFDRAALEAQQHLAAIQNVDGLLFCGSYCGYGFHEDALASGLDAAERLGAVRPWAVPAGRPQRREPATQVRAILTGALPLPATAREPA